MPGTMPDHDHGVTTKLATAPGAHPPHSFEFMDLAAVPDGLRLPLREILECGNSLPFRGYYRWVASQIAARCAAEQLTEVVELGAGTAPLTRCMLRDPACA